MQSCGEGGGGVVRISNPHGHGVCAGGWGGGEGWVGSLLPAMVQCVHGLNDVLIIIYVATTYGSYS